MKNYSGEDWWNNKAGREGGREREETVENHHRIEMREGRVRKKRKRRVRGGEGVERVKGESQAGFHTRAKR